jgi:hypothetical protein
MPSPSSAITRLELGSTYEEFDLKMNQRGFIGSQVLRPRIVAKNSGDVGKVPLKQLLQSRSTKRAPGSPYARDNWEFDKFAFSVQEFGKEEPLDDAQLAMYGDLIDAERVCADRAEEAVLNEFERDVSTAVFNATTWTGAALTTAITNEWDDYANADPINDVHAAAEKVSAGSGVEPNALILNRSVYRNLLQCDQVVDRIKFTVTPTASALRSALAELFDLRYVLVAGGFKNTANEGQAASLSRIWDPEYVMVARVAETDDPREPCIGRTFIWPGDGPGAPGDGGALAVLMEEYREEKVRGTVFRARNNRDIVIMHAACGHLLSNATTI